MCNILTTSLRIFALFVALFSSTFLFAESTTDSVKTIQQKDTNFLMSTVLRDKITDSIVSQSVDMSPRKKDRKPFFRKSSLFPFFGLRVGPPDTVGLGIEEENRKTGMVFGFGKVMKYGNKSFRKSLQISFWNQFIMRATQMNPGTDIRGQLQNPNNYLFDMSMRRMRVVFITRLSRRFKMVLHLGADNLTFLNKNNPGTTPFVHDAFNELLVLGSERSPNFIMFLAAGLHYFAGPTRIANGSTSRGMLADLADISLPLSGRFDEAGRYLGLTAYGYFMKRLQYRVSLDNAFQVNQTLDSTGRSAVINPRNGVLTTTGYFSWQFFNKEDGALGFGSHAGTYLGTAKVLNVNVGYYYTPASTVTYTRSTDHKQYYDISMLAFDMFGDLPFGHALHKQAITFYALFMQSNLGPNFLNIGGAMNPSTTKFSGRTPNPYGWSQSGYGLSQGTLGTGQTFHMQLGYLFASNGSVIRSRVQLMGSYTLKRFDAYDNRVTQQFDVGFNVFIRHQNAKMVFQYSRRPVFYTTQNGTLHNVSANNPLLLQYRGMFTFGFFTKF